MRKLIMLAAALPLLAACGSDQFSRVSTGAGTGAGTGATIGLIGGPIGVGLGAIIGAGVGAVAGGATTQDQLDLGNPIWRDKNATAGQVASVPPSPSNDPQYRPPAPAQPGPAYVPTGPNRGAVSSEQLAPPTPLR
jgi:hypothetical protein